MASPVLESFCCMSWWNTSGLNVSANSSFEPLDVHYNGFIISYNTLCIASSALSVCGAVYQLVPRQPRLHTIAWSQLNSVIRQNTIICWLAIADLFASIGVLVRSCLWIAGRLPVNGPVDDFQTSSDFAHWFCAISSAWVQYFYICTYFWTFIYAIDVYRLTMRKPSCMRLYHAISWGLSAFLCALGLVFLFYPSHFRCCHDIPSLLPHYLSSYIPMCLVMVANPILYSKSSAAVKRHLYSSGTYTRHEREIVRATDLKFREILIVFYVCWSTNIINGILLLVQHYSNVSKDVNYAVWHLMAVLNPLQGFLNSIIYRGVGLFYLLNRGKLKRDDNFASSDVLPSMSGTNNDEVSPLLHQF